MNDVLIHHGILGQKWGVRRFRNYDGSLTKKGKKRYDNDPTNGSTKDTPGMSNKTKTKIGVAAGAALATTALTAAAVKHPEAAKKVAFAIGKVGGKTAKNVGNRLVKAGDKAVDAALVSVGTIAASKVVSKITDKPGDSQTTKNVKQIARDSARAGITTAFGSNKSGKNNGNNSSNKDFSKIAGKPEGVTIDKQSKAYNNLFAGVDGNTRNDIKAMANQGYSIEQIRDALELKHGEIIVRRRR